MFMSSPATAPALKNSKVPRSLSAKKVLSYKDLVIHLVECGYRYCKPKCRTWKSAFVFRHENTVLCILIRKNGIDLRYYASYANEILIDKDNNLFMVGGELFKNHYNESSNLLNPKIKVISSCFTKGRVMDEMRTEDGRSYLLNPKYKKLKEASMKKFTERWIQLKEDKDRKEISVYLHDDCGGYWGDGVWS